MNRIVIGSDVGSYTLSGREITLASLGFSPVIEQLAYVFNITQNKIYYAPAEGVAKCSLSDTVITIDNGFPVLQSTDKVHIQFWYPDIVSTATAQASLLTELQGKADIDETQPVSNTVLTNAVDGVTTAIKFIDYIHHEIHDGSFFEYINAQDLTNGQTISFVVVTSDTTKWAHFGFTVEAELEFDLQMFEGATPANNGTLVSNPAVVNANRNISDVHTTLIYGGPTLGGGSKGTLIRRFHGGSGKKVGGVAGTSEEIVLKQNTKYWFDLTNISTSNNFISWVVGWYEHTNS